MPPTPTERLRRDQSGFTLIETLVVTMGLAVIIMAILGLVDLANRMTPNDQERAYSVRDAQTGLDQMVRELRQFYEINVSSDVAQGRVLVRGVARHVRYDCSEASGAYKKCTRQVIGSGGGPKSTVVHRVANGAGRPVFVPSPTGGNPTYVKVLIETPAKGTRKTGSNYRVALEDGFYLRSLDASR